MSERQVIHVRTIQADVVKLGDDEIEVTGRLVDQRPGDQPTWFGVQKDATVHDMALTLRVRHPDLVITAASASMATHPYTICPGAVPRVQQLVGISVRHGFTRAVNERLGRRNGCSHLTALVQAMGPVVRQGAGAAFGNEAEMPRPGDGVWWVDTCHAWREDGPLMDLVRANDGDGLRSLSAPGTAT
ncbi:MAG: DUF2889 domain-containing protein [Candidatus Rokubacteria bacterium]|nr:DUF2889 domain-containing protein [Candidatus Rokubacteria bacterium]